MTKMSHVLGATSIQVINFLGEVTNQFTNYKSPIFLFQVTKMCCKIQMRLRILNVCHNLIIQHILVAWNRKNGDLKLVIRVVTSPKNWWLEWTARLNTSHHSIEGIGWFYWKSVTGSILITLREGESRSNKIKIFS